MKTAERFQRPPSDYLGELPEWKDRLLEFAYTLYLEGLCGACGGPRFECHHPDNAGQYVADSVICHKTAAIEEHTGQKGFKPEPGQRFYAAEIDDELIVRRSFAVLPKPDDRGNESGDSG